MIGNEVPGACGRVFLPDLPTSGASAALLRFAKHCNEARSLQVGPKKLVLRQGTLLKLEVTFSVFLAYLTAPIALIEGTRWGRQL